MRISLKSLAFRPITNRTEFIRPKAANQAFFKTGQRIFQANSGQFRPISKRISRPTPRDFNALKRYYQNVKNKQKEKQMRQHFDYEKELNRIVLYDVIEEIALIVALFVFVLMIIK